jgi:hypothetical protein
MPVTLTFDIVQNSIKDPNDRTRLIVMFRRLGWEHIGGSSWRYPALGSEHPSEDWFNHVVPALMYFRSLVQAKELKVSKFTIDAHSEAGYRQAATGHIGQPIESGNSIATYPTGLKKAYDDKLSDDRLKQFVDDCANSLK